jgi:RNase H-fold protein (predicted Holliday junction resolvase)
MVTPVGSMSNDESLFFNIADILQRYHIETIVIGYPKQHKYLQKKIDEFLEQVLYIEHEMKMIRRDEEYTSVEA